jgi:hypothetical protein
MGWVGEHMLMSKTQEVTHGYFLLQVLDHRYISRKDISEHKRSRTLHVLVDTLNLHATININS